MRCPETSRDAWWSGDLVLGLRRLATPQAAARCLAPTSRSRVVDMTRDGLASTPRPAALRLERRGERLGHGASLSRTVVQAPRTHVAATVRCVGFGQGAGGGHSLPLARNASQLELASRAAWSFALIA